MASGIYTSNHTGSEIDKAISIAGSVVYTTEAPTTNVGSASLPTMQIAFLDQLPASLLNGWVYIISNNNVTTDIIAVLSDGTQITIK